jgi:hypothetical protein
MSIPIRFDAFRLSSVIFGGGHFLKVGRIDAFTVLTQVVKLSSSRNVTNLSLIEPSVGADLPATPLESAVPVWVGRTGPEPASGCLFNHCHKSVHLVLGVC